MGTNMHNGHKNYISVLGTGTYRECNYVFNEYNCISRYVQEASAGICALNETDRITIFLTEEAKVKHWIDSEAVDSANEGLASVLRRTMKCQIQSVDIPA